jgi:hypothetical protein
LREHVSKPLGGKPKVPTQALDGVRLLCVSEGALQGREQASRILG